MALKELWSLDVPTSGPAVETEQGKQFVEDFKAALEQVNPSLQFTAVYADTGRHQPLADRREQLVEQFREALDGIDPEDPASAESAIEDTLTGTKALGGDSAALRQETEQALQAWQAQEPQFEQASDQVDELQDWETPEAEGCVRQVSAVRRHVDERRFVEACTGCEQLLAGLGPIYERFLAQKAAQARYEQALAELQPRLLDAQQCEFQSLMPLQDELAVLEQQMRGTADARDFIAAEPLLTDLAAKVDICLDQRDALAARKAEYEQTWAAVEPRLPSTDEAGGDAVQTLVQQIGATADEATAAAAVDDFDAAIRLAGEIEPPLAQLQALREQRERFEAEWALVEPKMPQASSASPALAAPQAQLEALRQQTEAAAAAGDYDEALALLPSLEGAAADVQRALEALEEQRLAFEATRAAIEPRLPTTTEPFAGRLAELQSQTQHLLADVDAAAAAEDYEPAMQGLQSLEAPLAEMASLLALRDDYVTRLAELEPLLPAADEPGTGRLGALIAEITQDRGDAERLAESCEFEAALQVLGGAEDLLAEYQPLHEQRLRFDEAWGQMEPRLPASALGEVPPEAVERSQIIVDSRGALEALVAAGEYEDALRALQALEPQLEELEQVLEAAALDEAVFRNLMWPSVLADVEPALAAGTDIPEVQATLDALREKKQAVDAAVAVYDYAAAADLVPEVKAALQAHQEELRKSPRECDWVRDTATQLLALIDAKYHVASAKVLRAAQAYDAALAEHKIALGKVAGARQLADDLLWGVFFAALGGAAGGAAGSIVKAGLTSAISKAFTDEAAGGAVIDATKDVAKFTTRYIDKFRGKAGDPTAIVAKVGGNGVELARSFGIAVEEQAAALDQEVVKLIGLVKENEACDDGLTVRVEGDPVKALETDPFLKALEGINDVTQQAFARGLWAVWIDNWAYTLEQECDELVCGPAVGDNVGDFFAWWGGLLANIEDQTGGEAFELDKKLAAARARVEKEVEAQQGLMH